VPDWVRVARDRIEHQPPSRALRMADLARELGVSPAWFDRRFRAAYGLTPSACRRRVVLREAARFLAANPEVSVAEVATRSGYASQAAFARAFRVVFGVSPGRHRRPEAGANPVS
jgi:AraC-like DNA-binding protein